MRLIFTIHKIHSDCNLSLHTWYSIHHMLNCDRSVPQQLGCCSSRLLREFYFYYIFCIYSYAADSLVVLPKSETIFVTNILSSETIWTKTMGCCYAIKFFQCAFITSSNISHLEKPFCGCFAGPFFFIWLLCALLCTH